MSSDGATDAADAPAPPARPGRRTLVGALSLGAVMLLSGVAIATSGGDTDPAPGGVAALGGGTQTVQVSLVEMAVVPGVITVDPGTHLVLEVTNDGAMRHDLAFGDGTATSMLAPGQSGHLDLGTVTEPLTGVCTVPGHEAAGMTLTVHVTGADPPAGPVAQDEAASIDPAADPEPGFRPYDATLPPAPDARTHHLTLRVTDETVAVAPGVTQRTWTFGGTVPGPTLRGQVGDTFVVTLVNDAAMGHSIDFHAGALAPDEPMRTIEPGERLVYEFTAEHAGAWMYHCATAPMTHHIGNGMYGAVIVDPPDLPEVDAEYALVQSELYLGPDGGHGDFARMTRGEPDAVVFNGYHDQYRHAPLTVAAGDRVRVWLVNAGLERPSAFHVVGTRFDTVFLDGGYLVRPGNEARSAAQALALLPGQGGYVEFTIPEPGRYPFLSHIMTDAARGASGVIDASGEG
jgi:nitrite reductase (NO-forming)